MRLPLLILAGLLLTTVFSLADEPSVKEPGSAKSSPEVEAFLIPAAEEKYAAEVAKAAAHVSKAKQAAAEVRLKSYRDELSKFTKAGDFDRAIAVKERIKQIEGEGQAPGATVSRQRPKDTVKFGGHSYAIIREPATWHVAKRRCEEMGGHLVVLDSNKETEWFRALCHSNKISCWVGASDEEDEGIWRWLDGRKVPDQFMKNVNIDNQHKAEHWLLYAVADGRWHDTAGRQHYACEWDN